MLTSSHRIYKKKNYPTSVTIHSNTALSKHSSLYREWSKRSPLACTLKYRQMV